MAKKAVEIKLPPKPRTADEFVSAGRELPPTAAPEVMRRFTFDISADLHTRIKKGCADRGLPMVEVLRGILEREFPR